MLAAKSSVCVLLCLGFVAADVKTIFEEDGKDYAEYTVIKSVNIHNSLMTVVRCDSIEVFEPHRSCNITQTNLDTKEKSAVCEFVLDEYLGDVIGHSFTENKAILVSQTLKNSKEHYAKYTIINFPDCKTAEIKINFESYEAVRNNLLENKDAILINDDNTFDIFHNDAKVCGNKVCILKFDAQGNKIKGPIPSFIPLEGAIRHMTKVPSTSNFIVTELQYDRSSTKRVFLFSLIKPDGQVVLKEFTFRGEVKNNHVISTSNGLISLCSVSNDTTKVDCEQFDNNGMKMTKISVNVNQNVETIAIQNLGNEDFLLLVEGEHKDFAIKVKSRWVVGVAEVSRFNSNEYSKYESYVDFEKNEYCVTRKGFGFTKLEVLKQCFGDSDFRRSTEHSVRYTSQ